MVAEDRGRFFELLEHYLREMDAVILSAEQVRYDVPRVTALRTRWVGLRRMLHDVRDFPPPSSMDSVPFLPCDTERELHYMILMLMHDITRMLCDQVRDRL